MSPYVPTPDVLPVPAPVPLFEALLHLTFTVHLLVMNALLGGLIIAGVAWFRRKADGDPEDRLVVRITKLVPTLYSLTVTTGVAPLLFMQVLYGHFFYTSSIIMGWPWFLVVVVLILGYYAAYLGSFKGTKLGMARGPMLLISGLAVLYTGFMLSNNTSLMLTPDRWADMYFDAPGGTSLNTGDHVLWPRFLHMVLGAVAVAGLFLASLGQREKNDAELGGLMVGRGLTVFLVLTVVNIVMGFGYLMALEREVMLQFMGDSGHATGMLGLGVVMALVMVGLGFRARSRPGASLTPLWIVTVLTVVVMVLMRDFVRKATLGLNYDPSSFAVAPQWLNIGIFVVLLVAGLATVAWMVRKLLTAKP